MDLYDKVIIRKGVFQGVRGVIVENSDDVYNWVYTDGYGDLRINVDNLDKDEEHEKELALSKEAIDCIKSHFLGPNHESLTSNGLSLCDVDTESFINAVKSKMESIKNDKKDDKLRWDLLPLEEIEDIVRVYHAGAKKYGPNRWQHLPDGYNRYRAALLRHLMEAEKGNEVDSDTGCLHLAQVAWNAIAMLYLSKRGEGVLGKVEDTVKSPDDKVGFKLPNIDKYLEADPNDWARLIYEYKFKNK